MAEPTRGARIHARRLRLVDAEASGEAGVERHASWLELFFDLVFVVAVAALARTLHDDLSVRGLVIFGLLFVPVWWQWIDFSYFLDQFDAEDLLHKLGIFAVMFGVIALAITIPGAAQGDSRPFVLAILALRALMILYYWDAWRDVAESRELTGRYLLSFCIAFVVWAASLAVPAPARYALWALAQGIEIANGPITYLTIRNVPQQISHMDERFGLFVIIVLGEAVLQVALGIDGVNWQWRGTATAVAVFLIAGRLVGARLATAVLAVVALAGAGTLGVVAIVVILVLLFLALAGIETRGVPARDSEPAAALTPSVPAETRG